MNDPFKILFAGMCGALASLLIVNGVGAAATAMKPTRVLHYYGPEPLSDADQALADAAEAKAKAERVAKSREFAERCVSVDKHVTVLVTDSGMIACSWVGMPPERMLESK